MALLVGLDLGTTSIKAILLESESGEILASASRPTPVFHPRPGWSEHDPEAIWQVCVSCLRECAGGRPVKALAIASMAEAGLPVDAHGNPLYPIIAWYDRRSSPQAERVERAVGRENLYTITGQRSSASFGLTKWLWLRENLPGAVPQTATWLPLPSYILFRLCGHQAVDYSIASRALLLDQNSLAWSSTLLELAGLSENHLPTLAHAGTPVVTLTPKAARETGLPDGVLCVLGGHDHLCASFAAGGHLPGTVVDSTGTAEAVLLVIPGFLPNPTSASLGLACYAHVLPGKYVLKGGLKAAGSAIEWLARILMPESEDPDYAALEAEAWQGVGKTPGPLWLPHFLESGSPEADPFSRAALVGAHLGHTRGDFFRGLLESLSFWLRENLEKMQEIAGISVEKVVLIGGTTRLGLFCQLKADVLNRPVFLPEIPEASATGAALLAGLGCGLFRTPEDALAPVLGRRRILEPDPTRSAWYDHLYHQVYTPLYHSLRDIHHTLSQL